MSALPELPKFGYGYYEEVDYELNIWHGTSYTAPQMREYGDARAAHARKQALEEAMQACRDVEEPGWTGYECPNTFSDGQYAAEAAIKELLK